MKRAVVLLLAFGASGCAARSSTYREIGTPPRGNPDAAVERLEREAGEAPDDIALRIALINARIEAARFHRDEARKYLDAERMVRAAEELERSLELDPTNRYAAEVLAEVQRRIEEGAPPRPRPPDHPLPDTVLSFEFEDTSLRTVLETLAELAGVNILFDEAYRDRTVSVDLQGVTFREALELLTRTNGLFYEVERSRTVGIGAAVRD